MLYEANLTDLINVITDNVKRVFPNENIIDTFVAIKDIKLRSHDNVVSLSYLNKKLDLNVVMDLNRVVAGRQVSIRHRSQVFYSEDITSAFGKLESTFREDVLSEPVIKVEDESTPQDVLVQLLYSHS